MKSYSTSYILRLAGIGVAAYIFIGSLVGIYLFYSKKGVDLYDFGVLLTSIGGTLAFLVLFIFFSSALWKHQIRRYLPPDDQVLPARDARSDYLLTLAISTLLVTFTGLLLVWHMVSIGERKPVAGYYPHIGSVRAALNDLHEYAIRWQSDAYLVEVTLEMGDESPYRMSATYKSPSVVLETLLIYVETDGNIASEIYEMGSSWGQRKAIHDLDWRLDSEDALRIFAANDDIGFCLMSSAQRANRLELTRLSSADNQPIVWRLFLPDCLTAPSGPYYLDAQTGKWLYSE